MKFMQTTRLILLGTMLGIAALSASSAFAEDNWAQYPFATHVAKMADKDGMVKKEDFTTIMSKRFDMMDKNKTGKIPKRP